MEGINERIEARFSRFDEAGRSLVARCFAIAATVLSDELRGNGHPFIEHPLNVALIASDEIGLPAECAAAVFVHEATRCHPELDLRKGVLPGDPAAPGTGGAGTDSLPTCWRWSRA